MSNFRDHLEESLRDPEFAKLYILELRAEIDELKEEIKFLQNEIHEMRQRLHIENL